MLALQTTALSRVSTPARVTNKIYNWLLRIRNCQLEMAFPQKLRSSIYSNRHYTGVAIPYSGEESIHSSYGHFASALNGEEGDPPITPGATAVNDRYNRVSNSLLRGISRCERIFTSY